MKIKGIILLIVAFVFLIVLAYSLFFQDGGLKTFLSAVIVLVCTGLGIMYLKGDSIEQRGQKRNKKKKRR